MLPNLFIFYVDSPEATAAFYATLLGREPVESSPTFAMFVLSGVSLAFWSRHTVDPAPAGGPGVAEIVFQRDDVDAAHADWVGRGLSILQPPVDLDFGRTFVALDPDGHRLRVFKPREA